MPGGAWRRLAQPRAGGIPAEARHYPDFAVRFDQHSGIHLNLVAQSYVDILRLSVLRTNMAWVVATSAILPYGDADNGDRDPGMITVMQTTTTARPNPQKRGTLLRASTALGVAPSGMAITLRPLQSQPSPSLPIMDHRFRFRSDATR
jgi:hypothetical protein